MKNLIALLCVVFTASLSMAQCPKGVPAAGNFDASTLVLGTRTQVATTVWGGDYSQLINVVPGATYRVDLCEQSGAGNSSQNTHVTVYEGGNNNVVGFNDDFCGDDAQVDVVVPIGVTALDLQVNSSGCGNFATNTTIHVTLISGAACADPDVPTLASTPVTVCNGGTASLNITGSLNDATAWHVYTGSCGGTSIGTTATGTFAIPGTITSTTTYFVRGEGGCVTPGSCGTVTITPQDLDDASFSYSAATYCSNDTDPTPTITGLGGGSFSSTAGLTLNGASGAIDVSTSTPGTYTITYTTTGTCPNSSNVSVTINALDDASFSYSAAAYCSGDTDPTPTITGLAGGGFTSAPGGLSINSSSGAIDVSTSTPGTYTVTYTTTGLCPNSSNVSVTVNAADDASFLYSAASYCVGDIDPTPTITGLGGGSFSSTAGLTLNAGSGLIDVSTSTPGTYTVTYTTAGTCPNSSNVSVTINTLDDASFSYSAAAYCSGDTDPTPTITGLVGGSFSSTAGLTLNATSGVVDVSTSTPGTYTVTYTSIGPCPNSSNVSVTVNAADDASFLYSAASYCVGDIDPTPTITGLSGGSFSSTAGLTLNAGSGLIDVSTSTPGTYTVTYTTAGTCPNSSNISVTINATDDASFSYSAAAYCSGDTDPTPTITGLGGGSFSSTAGLTLNGGSGAIDVSTSTPGTYTVTYTTAGACPNSSSVSVTVNAADDASFSYSAATYCVADIDPTATITGLSGGSFSSTAGLTLNGGSGTIDVSASTPGTYTVTYTTAGTCPNSSNVSVTINAADDASFSYSAATYCAADTDPTPTITGLGGGSFSSTAGLTLNGGSGAIDVSTSTPGTYTVTYTTSGACSNSSNVIVVIAGASSGTDVQVACDTYTWIDGMTYTSSTNTPTFVIPNAAGCDSTITLDLTINNSSTGTDVQTACDTYTWIDGMAYTSSTNTPTFVIPNAAGCDSTITLDLTINNASTGIDVQAACGAYTWIDGVTYTSSTNTPTFVIPNAAGCDSTVTLDLTILTEVMSTITEIACETFTWAENGMTYTASGMYADTIFGGSVQGCDSIIVLDLTINTATAGTDVQVACDSYTWINGVTYTTSNSTATEVLLNAAGCDSIVTLDLTMNNSVTTTEEVFVCEDTYTWSVNGMTYAASGTYSELLTASNGCDSTVVLQLTIGGGIDLTVTSVDETLIAAQFIALYQWIDCDNGNTPIAGANGQSFTPEVTGNYAVIIEDNGCIDTSACYTVNVSDLDELDNVSVTLYPNPVLAGYFIVNSDDVILGIDVVDLLGRKLNLSIDKVNNTVDVTPLSQGKYIVIIRTIKGVSTKEILIQK